MSSVSKFKATEQNIPLADDDSAQEITEVDILKLSLGSGNKARAATAAAAAVQSGTLNPIGSSNESIPYYSGGATSNSSSSPAQPNCKQFDYILIDFINH